MVSERNEDSLVQRGAKKRVLLLASVASMIDQFHMPGISLLLEMGLEVHVACNFKEGNTCDKKRLEKLKERLTTMQARWHQWDCPRDLRLFALQNLAVPSAASCARAYRQLLKWFRQYSYAWIHCQSPVGGVLARLAAKRCGIRVMYTAHGFHFYQGAPLKNWLLYYPVEKLLAYWTDMLITVNQEDYCFAKRNLRAGNVYSIPGVGIAVERFQRQPMDGQLAFGKETCPECCGTDHFFDCRRKYRIPQDSFLLLSVGELSRRKNHQAVIEALSKLSRKDIYYIICGQGALKEKLVKQAKELGVEKRVRFVGYQEDTVPFYHAADLFVFPSLQEGMPVALMEAMAAGLACVVSDIRGNRELIDTGGGIRFSIKKKEQLCTALEAMLSNHEFRSLCGRRNQNKIKSYGQQVVQERMRELYRRMNEKQPQRKKLTKP